MPDLLNQTITLPFIPLRGINIFPGMLLTFEVERASSVSSLTRSVNGDHLIFLAAQRNVAEDMPDKDGIYSVGTVCKVRQQLRIPQSNACRAMVEGLYRASAKYVPNGKDGFAAVISPLPDRNERVSEVRMEAALRQCLELYEQYIHMNTDMINEQLLDLIANPEPSHVAFFIAHTLKISPEDKQSILECLQPYKRLVLLSKLLANELNILTIEQELKEATQEELNKTQREYYLREELKAIHAELGEEPEEDEIEEYRSKLLALPVSDEIRDKLMKTLGRLAKQPFASSEAAVERAYLDTCLEIPWGVSTQETIDLDKARKQLDKDHFGLEKVKDRIIEYLAVKQLSPEIKGGLICLVGPPGTGKTSIAMSIARAVNRKLVRISLGGVHDEAEIRGHRKTYIGSMPGRIINGIIQAGSCNPLMVLDEIDKLGSDYKGDPSAALLETLDSEQNSTFRDNYLELPFDLSGVFFITTANTTDTIPRALLDRMEVIELSSYTDEEKLQIARNHLLPKQRKKHGLNARQLKVSDDAVRNVIVNYTRESGVRVLERELASLCRKAARGIASGEYGSLNVTPSKLKSLLGPEKFKDEEKNRRNQVGLVRGLAYTSVGGEVLDVEASVVDGTGKIELTGNLGDVMKESAMAAVTYIRSRASELGLQPDFYKTKDIHIHFPEGAVPKDGPSAGITVTVAVVSALTGSAVRQSFAMTGEITLRGRVLPIGGLREKTMAAYRNGVKTVIIPADNISDLEEIDPVVRNGLKFIPTDHVDNILETVLEFKKPEPGFIAAPNSTQLREAIRQ